MRNYLFELIYFSVHTEMGIGGMSPQELKVYYDKCLIEGNIGGKENIKTSLLNSPAGLASIAIIIHLEFSFLPSGGMVKQL